MYMCFENYKIIDEKRISDDVYRITLYSDCYCPVFVYLDLKDFEDNEYFNPNDTIVIPYEFYTEVDKDENGNEVEYRHYIRGYVFRILDCEDIKRWCLK